jgi:succinate dehydrogenase / fumarate reductase membrane anchor subunit
MATGRPRPIGSRRELAGWYLMRLSGLGLFVLALSHFLITHVVYDPAEQTAAWIIDERWGDALWRVTDASMLVLVVFHSFYGVRTVLRDHVGPGVLRRALTLGLALVGLVLAGLGLSAIAGAPGPLP